MFPYNASCVINRAALQEIQIIDVLLGQTGCHCLKHLCMYSERVIPFSPRYIEACQLQCDFLRLYDSVSNSLHPTNLDRG
jgi:hypothetical protein